MPKKRLTRRPWKVKMFFMSYLFINIKISCLLSHYFRRKSMQIFFCCCYNGVEFSGKTRQKCCFSSGQAGSCWLYQWAKSQDQNRDLGPLIDVLCTDLIVFQILEALRPLPKLFVVWERRYHQKIVRRNFLQLFSGLSLFPVNLSQINYLKKLSC